MAYDKQEWVDDDGSGTTGTLFTAGRMNHMEDGIESAEGTPGPPGESTEWLFGTGDPDNDGGEDGDFYLQENGKVWEKQAGVWVYTAIDLSGPPGINWMGDWVQDQVYAAGDAVAYQGSSWYAIQTTTSPHFPPHVNVDSWDPLAMKGSGFVYAGAWGPDYEYPIGSTVAYQGATYVALVNPNSSVIPSSDPAVWGIMAEQGPAGVPGPGILARGEWVSGTTYHYNLDGVSDWVTYQGQSWLRIADGGATNVPPPAAPAKWVLMASKGADGAPGAAGAAGATGPMGGVYVGAAAPPDPAATPVWIDTDDPMPYTYPPPLVGALPLNPAEGQEVYLRYGVSLQGPVLTDTPLYHMRYSVANAGPFKWERLGGGWTTSRVDDSDAIPIGTSIFVDPAHVGPSITPDLPGIYECEFICNAFGSGATNVAMTVGISLTGAAPAIYDIAQSLSVNGIAVNPVIITQMTLAASTQVKVVYIRHTAVIMTYRWRQLRLRPVKL